MRGNIAKDGLQFIQLLTDFVLYYTNHIQKSTNNIKKGSMKLNKAVIELTIDITTLLLKSLLIVATLWKIIIALKQYLAAV